jgi:hypothetical protein
VGARPSWAGVLAPRKRKIQKIFVSSEKCCTFAPLFRRNRWKEEELPVYVARNLLKIKRFQDNGFN